MTALKKVDLEGRAERSGALVERKKLEQWFFKITEYQEELLSGLDSLDWPARVKRLQANWIGRVDGYQVACELVESPEKDIDIFFTDLPVTTYIGGVEHAILHLLYARFIGKFLFKSGIAPGNAESSWRGEPFQTLIAQGMVTGKTFKCKQTGRYLKPEELDLADPTNPVIKTTGEPPQVTFEKMSKSKYNGVDPTEMIDKYGSDCTRLYVLFKAAPADELLWDEHGIIGMERWLARSSSPAFRLSVENLVKMLAPFAPSAAKEFHVQLGYPTDSVCLHWPAVAQDALKLDDAVCVIMLNGKSKGFMKIPVEYTKSNEKVKRLAMESDVGKKFLVDPSTGQDLPFTQILVLKKGTVINFLTSEGSRKKGK
ncbi:UNVERIFIED_CONTAM: Leucyl-tRNA synthetase, mitochondrial [Siphonaria sp. JEL0065]|nr:Leucyl-tRNA synthetase, mitochondrial [Siphonaria sp. JEL0065]